GSPVRQGGCTAAEDVVVDVLHCDAALGRTRRVPDGIAVALSAWLVVLGVILRPGDDEHLLGVEQGRGNGIDRHQVWECPPHPVDMRDVGAARLRHTRGNENARAQEYQSRNEQQPNDVRRSMALWGASVRLTREDGRQASASSANYRSHGWPCSI